MLRLNLIFICLFILFQPVFSQSKMALVKELTEQDGVFYLRGEKFSGIAFEKNDKGKFISEEPFKKGLIHGKRVNYNTKGSPIAREKFKNGKGILRTYYSNNRIKSFGPVNKSIKFGEWIYYNKKGVLKAKEFWSEEISNQLIWEKYYNNRGIIESEMFYEMGILNREVYYDDKGKVFKTNKN